MQADKLDATVRMLTTSSTESHATRTKIERRKGILNNASRCWMARWRSWVVERQGRTERERKGERKGDHTRKVE